MKTYLVEETASDSQANTHLKALIEYLEDSFERTSKSLEPLLENGEITFDLVWALFIPSQSIFSIHYGSEQPRCLTYVTGEYKNTNEDGQCFELDCRYLDYDGKRFGEVTTSLRIPEFRATRKITTLDAYPLKYHAEKEAMQEELIARGRKFISLLGINHLHYDGLAFRIVECKPVKFRSKGRLMIDVMAFREEDPNYRKGRVDPRQGVSEKDLSDDDLLRCAPTLQGFSFASKIWGMHNIRVFTPSIVFDAFSVFFSSPFFACQSTVHLANRIRDHLS